MQTTYRIKVQEVGMKFLKSLKNEFAGQEVEIIVKTVESKEKELSEGQKTLLEMINDNRQKAPVVAPNIDIRSLIDDSQYSSL